MGMFFEPVCRQAEGDWGGIVWDSTPVGEWNAGLLKARFLADLAKTPIHHLVTIKNL